MWGWFCAFRTRRRLPVQLELPIWCGNYGDTCGPYIHTDAGFYGRCVKCGVRYEPVCDR